LSSLTKLTRLDLSGNRIAGISPLAALSNLSWLQFSANLIADISPLVDNSGLGKGDEVWLEANSLDLSEGSDDLENIRRLEARGVVVHY
jgi:internalin A